MSTTKNLVLSILQAISQKPLTVVEIAKTTNTTDTFIYWVVNSKRYGDLFAKTINGFDPSLISSTPKGLQFLANATDNTENPL